MFTLFPVKKLSKMASLYLIWSNYYYQVRGNILSFIMSLKIPQKGKNLSHTAPNVDPNSGQKIPTHRSVTVIPSNYDHPVQSDVLSLFFNLKIPQMGQI